MKWYQNKYVQATAVALATGTVAALLMYVGTLTDGLDMRHTVKAVGLAFLGPFSVLVTVLPKITDILTPTVRIVSQERVAKMAAEAPEQSLLTTEPYTTVVVDDGEVQTTSQSSPIPRPPKGKVPQADVVTTG